MGAFLKRLWSDPEYFKGTCRGAVMFFGTLVASGVITPPATGDTAIGWYTARIIGAFMAAAAVLVKMGDQTPPAAKALSYADPIEMAKLMDQLKVPPNVADKAAERTADQAPPKV